MARPGRRRVNSDDEIVLAIPGDRVRGRRTRVAVGRNPDLTDTSLRILLHLMVARHKGEMANKVDMGSTADQGFKGISNLCSELKPALGDVKIVQNKYHGDYRLIDRVRIGDCAFDKLRQKIYVTSTRSSPCRDASQDRPAPADSRPDPSGHDLTVRHK